LIAGGWQGQNAKGARGQTLCIDHGDRLRAGAARRSRGRTSAGGGAGPVFDQYQGWKPRPYAFDQPVRIVAIDDESLNRLGQWPWSRDRLATLVDALKRAGVASISFDFLFSEKDRGDATAPADKTPDAAFARSMDDGAVVLGSFVSDIPNGASPSTKAGFVTAGDDAAKFLPSSPGMLSPLPELAQHAAGIGFLNWRPDGDRVVRKVPLILNLNG
jgi:adenylate cyclase